MPLRDRGRGGRSSRPRPQRLRGRSGAVGCAAVRAVTGEAAPGSLLTRPLVLALLLIGLAAVLAPEQPWDQEAICQRHIGVEACRVW